MRLSQKFGAEIYDTVVLESLGLWVADLKKTGAEPHDLEALQK
jgi:hypothetical protein